MERVSEKLTLIDSPRNLLCILEVVLSLRQGRLAGVAVIMITKRVEIQKVNGFVALFAPIGLLPCIIRPLVDPALDLITSTTRQHPG